MNIKIRKLTPDLAEDYVHFFDVTPHDDGSDKDELPCYCVTWRSDDSYIDDNNHWYPTREERRERAFQFVKAGSLQGYLVYHDDEIVGWCNANADCKGGVSYLSDYWDIEEQKENIKVKSIFCFVIAPHMQRKGVATLLLNRVCSDAAMEGYDYVEAYVNESIIAYDFRGPLTMYEKAGFELQSPKDGRVVVRKALK